jgi:photosystem II stability/assembly factor-like uncharacterized protein
MKTLFLIISLIIFIPSTRDSLFAQGWFVAHSEPTRHFNSIFFTDANTGYTSGGGNFFTGGPFPLLRKTTNAGSSWFEQTSPQRDSAGFVYPDVFFTDMNTGFIAVTYFPNANFGRILKTTDGGTNWSIVWVGKGIWSIYFINSSTGYAAGYKTVLKTTDAGTTWVDKPFPHFLRDIHFTDVNTGYVVGLNGTILKTTNGGTDWDEQRPRPTNIELLGVSFADANTGIAVGGLYNDNKNIILRTTNAGLNWTEIPYDYSTCALLSVRFINPTTGWIAGRCSQIIKTTDGGASWFNQTSPVENIYFSDCFFTSALTGYIGGDGGGLGYILKTTNGGDELGGLSIPVGIEPISNEVPAQFQLEQNYPNPFNPTTKIRFALPKNSFATLVVYDMLGREISTLVNEQLNAGTYEADWQADKFSSGVYYYKLTVRQAGSSTGDFTETKKMILMK